MQDREIHLSDVRKSFAKAIYESLYGDVDISLTYYLVKLATDIDGMLDFSEAWKGRTLEKLCKKIIRGDDLK